MFLKGDHFLSVLEPSLEEPTQEEIDYFAKNVNVTLAVEDNFISGQKMGEKGVFLASVSLANTGKQIISAKRWQLFGYFMRLVEIDNYPYPQGFHLSSCGMKIFHEVGSLYRFEPDGWDFIPIKPYEIVTCRLKIQAFAVARSDFMPRWYVTGSTMPMIVANTDDETLSFIQEFTEEKQYKRRIDDKGRPFYPQERYQQFHSSEGHTATRFKIIPTPLNMKITDKYEMEFNTQSWVILKSETFIKEINHFSGKPSSVIQSLY